MAKDASAGFLKTTLKYFVWLHVNRTANLNGIYGKRAPMFTTGACNSDRSWGRLIFCLVINHALWEAY
jgi:hypothetical protein